MDAEEELMSASLKLKINSLPFNLELIIATDRASCYANLLLWKCGISKRIITLHLNLLWYLHFSQFAHFYRAYESFETLFSIMKCCLNTSKFITLTFFSEFCLNYLIFFRIVERTKRFDSTTKNMCLKYYDYC